MGQANYLANVFWTRFRSEYLTLLQKWHFSCRNLRVEDVVLVVDENLPRNQWALGRVIEIFPDSHGLTRKVKLRTRTSAMIR